MTQREKNVQIFRGNATDGPLWQPRIDHWYKYHKRYNTLPSEYAQLSEMQLHDELGCSPRPYAYFNECLRAHYPKGISVTTHQQGSDHVTVWSTPAGQLTSRRRLTQDSWMPIEHPIKSTDDIAIVEQVLAEQSYEFDQTAYERGCAVIGDRAAPTLYIPRINLQRLFLNLMGIEQTIYALADYPQRMRQLIKAIDESDPPLLETLARCPIEIINLGDNVDGRYLGPRLFEEFLLEPYRRRTAAIHAAGKFVHAHWDGHLQPILRYAQQTGLDGIEAATPIPQGDVTIEEIKEALGDNMVLLDGIPMLSFLPNTDQADLEKQVQNTVELFAPRLILGVSDEISPVCDIQRIRLVTDLLANMPSPHPTI